MPQPELWEYPKFPVNVVAVIELTKTRSCNGALLTPSPVSMMSSIPTVIPAILAGVTTCPFPAGIAYVDVVATGVTVDPTVALRKPFATGGGYCHA